MAAVESDGAALLNADDPLVATMASRSTAPVTYFGRGAQADIRAESVRLDDHGRAHFELHTPAQAPAVLGLLGEHHVSNALTTAAVAHMLGIATGRSRTR